MRSAVPADDRGLLLGDGLFETVLAEQGDLLWFDDHLARLQAGCAALGLPSPDPAAARQAALEALAAAGLAQGRAAVRLTWTAGSGGRGLDRPIPPQPRWLITAAPAPRPTAPVGLALVEVRRNEGSPASRHKTLAYLDNVLARREAQAKGGEEAVMLNNRGEAACAAAANFFWRTAEGWRTPALDCGALAGLARARVLALARSAGVEILEVREGAEDLARAEAAFISNSLIGVRAVDRLDGRPLAMDASLMARLDPLAA
ncbi:aminotransferase class IV [Phenylobacterium sp.]|uniref:aminotransferase class IV n=1 Tax=Phenylobacterium sp. TaxID=1871053 RepID=UPI002FD994BA